METISTITSAIVSIVSVTPIIKDRIFSIKRVRTYYKKLIIPYLNELIKNKNIDSCEFIKKQYKRTNENIPKYITYLVDINDNERLKKVLLYDYCFIYKNEKNNTLNFLNNFKSVTTFILNLLVIATLALSGLFITMFLYLSCEEIINVFNKNPFDFKNSISYLVLSVFLFLLSLFLFNIIPNLSQDAYTLKLYDIKKRVNEKVDWYDKNYNNHFI